MPRTAVPYLVPGPGSYVLLGALLLAVAVGAVWARLRWPAFERYPA